MGVLYIGRTKVGEFVFANKYKVTLTGEHCTFIGNGYHNYNQLVTIEAVPEIGYKFVNWSDGNTENPRSIRIDGDIQLEASTIEYSKMYYTATEDISGSLTTIKFGNATLVKDACVYNSTTQEGILMFIGDITSIPNNVFYEKYSLKSILIPNSVTSIGNVAFYKCSGLTSVTIPNSVTSIGQEAFSYSGLTSIIISNSVIRIGSWAFFGCSGLTSVTIGNSVTNIGGGMFQDCSNLTSIQWNIKNIANFSDSSNAPFYTIKSQITSFTFGNEVERIPAFLCYGMENLTSVMIPNSVTSIESWAFYGCSSITSIIIPNSVTIIGKNAFYNCTNIDTLTYEGTTKQWSSIYKGTNWYYNTTITKVTCSDGEVSLI